MSDMPVARMNRGGNARLTQYRAFVFLAMGALAIWIMYPFLKPLVMGAVFAVVLWPVHEFLERLTKRAGIRATIVTFLFFFLFVIPVALVIFLGAQKLLAVMHSGGTTMPENFSTQTLLQWAHVPEMVAKINEYLPVQYEDVQETLSRGLSSAGTILSGVLQSLLTGLPDMIVSGLVMLVTVYFCLVDGPKLVHFVRENSVFDELSTAELIQTTRSTCRSVINASIMVGLVQAGLMGLTALVAGTHNVVLILLVTLFASFLPVVGTAPVSIALALYYFYLGQTTPTLLYVAALCIIGLSDNFVRPWVIGGGSQMHPLVAFVAAFGGIAVMGFFGLFLGPIIVAVFFKMIPLFLHSVRTSRPNMERASS